MYLCVLLTLQKISDAFSIVFDTEKVSIYVNYFHGHVGTAGKWKELFPHVLEMRDVQYESN